MCECISRVNDSLKDKGVYLDTTCLINFTDNKITEVVRIRLLPREGRRKRDMPSIMSPDFCPFCGENRHAENDTPTTQESAS